MQGIVGALLFIVGMAGLLFPEETVQFWFFGLLEEDSLSGSGDVFFRGLGLVCMLVGLFVVFV